MIDLTLLLAFYRPGRAAHGRERLHRPGKTILLILFILGWAVAVQASFDIQSKEAAQFELKGYDGLSETILFRGDLAAGVRQRITTSYKGLGILGFAGGQSYPLILGKEEFLVRTDGPDSLPSFAGSGENEYFYSLLTGADNGQGQYEYPRLLIRARQLLESSSAIRSPEELAAKKAEFHSFVAANYEGLRHSDTVMRLLAQYFMMHEYVNYHVEGAPAADIRIQYEKAVVDGVKNWLDVLGPHLAANEVLNYIVSLYYQRSMVSLAKMLLSKFEIHAYCAGQAISPAFPGYLHIIDGKGHSRGSLGGLKGGKMIAFVSEDCPVSMVETVTRARNFAARNSGKQLIVIPLQRLSEKHLAMNRLVSGGNMLFVDDERWRKENLPERVKLPLFVEMDER